MKWTRVGGFSTPFDGVSRVGSTFNVIVPELGEMLK